ncbi:restriction endonuclease subunit S [Stutzerimonas chloritidismutans]|nr:restriction endonuclease subunit S [[Pseudomonas] sp. BICA1-14]KJS67588.1 MAG: type I restriction modification protein [[Pseudomonas] sp. BICA1-14]
MTALLTDNLPLLAGAPNGIKKLRELILELAVRGKLVPQDPNDEPAGELLKLLITEARDTTGRGKAKKQALPEVCESEQPYILPNGWAWGRLGDVADILDSLRRPVTKQDRKPGPYPYYGASGVVDYVSAYIFDEPLVLVGEDGAKWGVGERTAFSITGKTWVNNHAHVLRPKRDAICDDYLVISLTAQDLSQFITGMTVPKLNQARLTSIGIPLPPLAEQHRIVAKVDELIVLCDRLEAQQADAESAHAQLVQALLDSLTQTSEAIDFAANWRRMAEHFHTLFTTVSSIDALKQTLLQLAVMGKLVPQHANDEPASELLKWIAEQKARLMEGKLKKQKPVDEMDQKQSFNLPAGWEWVRLGSVSQIKGGKRLPAGATFSSKETPHVYIQVTNMKDGTIVNRNLKYIDGVTQTVIKQYTISKDDLYITIAGTIGDVGIVPSCFDGMNLTENAAKIVFQKIDKRWLQQALSSQFAQRQFSDSTNQLAQPKLALHRIADSVLALPPLAEQRRIVAKVDQLMALCDQLKTRLTQARRLNEQLATSLVEQAVASTEE